MVCRSGRKYWVNQLFSLTWNKPNCTNETFQTPWGDKGEGKHYLTLRKVICIQLHYILEIFKTNIYIPSLYSTCFNYLRISLLYLHTSTLPQARHLPLCQYLASVAFNCWLTFLTNVNELSIEIKKLQRALQRADA